jgi:hypothetical protein
MLYTSFRATVMIAAILGLLHMIAEGSFIYMFFPIAIIIWAIYTFFDENDREYLRRNGIDPDEISWFFPEYSDYGAVRDKHSTMNRTSGDYRRRSYPTRTTNSSYNGSMSADAQYARYAPQGSYYGYREYSNPVYKVLKDKCKRNFKITISKEKVTENDKENLQ